ncbi:DUF4189 domain-containing protein [Algirhabdus cladophorae]|uniref:DUF4189 domain-containing protein n=1 Tax=Algirhabdus cladophorae TaxID=3377108 RepID=UPI003B84B620
MDLSARHITPLDLVAAAAVLAVVVPFAAAGIPAKETTHQPRPVVLNMPAKLNVLDTPALPEDTQMAYAEWKAKLGHFGAFAVGEGTAYGWTDNYMTPEFAAARALDHCRDSGKGCKIIATMDYGAAPREDAIILSPKAAKAFKDYAMRPGAKAYAVSPWGGHGWAWSHKSTGMAKATAMANCNKHANNAKRLGYTQGVDCELISVSWAGRLSPEAVAQ